MKKGRTISEFAGKLTFALVAGLFKEPLFFVMGLSGILICVGFNLPALLKSKEEITPLKTLAELLKAGVAVFLYVQTNVSAWRQERTLSSIVESNLEKVRERLGRVGLKLEWTAQDLSTIVRKLYRRWAKEQAWSKIENDFVDEMSEQLLKQLGLEEGKRLFGKYVAYEVYPLSRSKFLASLDSADATPGSAKNAFVCLVKAATSSTKPFDLLTEPIIAVSKEEALAIYNQLSSGNLEFYRKTLEKKNDREALVAVAEQCIRQGYTSVEQILKFRRESQPFKMLIKYDERFTFFIPTLKEMAAKKHNADKVSQLAKAVGDIFNPYPFSHALQKYEKVLIRLLPRDMFVYLFDLNAMDAVYGIRDARQFMTNLVIPEAKEYHERCLQRVKKLDKSFVSAKKEFCANYYILDIDIETLVADADNKSIPEGMKRILVQDVLANGDFAQLLSSQELYIRGIIETMPMDALLFNNAEHERVRDLLRKERISIQRNLKTGKIPYATIDDKRTIGGKLNVVTEGVYLAQDLDGTRGGLPKKEIKEALKLISKNAEILATILKDGFKTN